MLLYFISKFEWAKTSHTRAYTSYQLISKTFTLNMFVVAMPPIKIFATLCLFIVWKNIAPFPNHVKSPSQGAKAYAFKSEKSTYIKSTTVFKLIIHAEALIWRKWRVALLQVVTRGLSVSSPGSRGSLTLESASGKATLDIMKHSLTGPLSLPSRIFWLKPFYKLL